MARECTKCGQEIFGSRLKPLSEYASYTSYEILLEPTHSESGRVRVTESVFDETFSFEGELKPLGHNFTQLTNVNEDYHRGVCSCGLEREDLPHTLQITVSVDADCQHKGYSDYRCSGCGATFRKYTEKTDHTFKNGVCACGEIQTLPVVCVDGDSRETKTFAYGTAFDIPAPGEEADRVFIGWYNEDGTKRYGEDDKIVSFMTVYAKWQIVTRIATKEAFLSIWNNPAGAYRLDADINLGGETLPELPLFSGMLDGGGHVVKNFSYQCTALNGSAYGGLIRENTGTIRNLTIRDYVCNINTANVTNLVGGAVGGVVGFNRGTVQDLTVDRSAFNATVVVNMPQKQGHNVTYHAGGLVGKNEGTIRRVSASFTYTVYLDIYNGAFGVSGDLCDNETFMNVGSVCGLNRGTVSSVTDTGDLTVSLTLGRDSHKIDGHQYVGGFVGCNDGSITACSYAGTVRYNKDQDLRWNEYERTTLGGFAALNYGTIEQCAAAATISGGGGTSSYMGGFVGQNLGTGRISTCYSDSMFTVLSEGENFAGGFAALCDALIQSCYAHGSITAQAPAHTGGFVGKCDNGGTVNHCYTRVAVVASTGYSGRFVCDNRGIVTRSFYVEDDSFDAGETATGDITGTTGIEAIPEERLTSRTFLADDLYWDEDGWTLREGEEPCLGWQTDGTAGGAEASEAGTAGA